MLRSAHIVLFLVLAALLAAPRSSYSRNLDTLMTRADRDGTVRILVELDVAFQPEGNLPDRAAADAQRQAIHNAQQRVLEHLPAQSVRDKTVFSTLPLLALEIDAPGLANLAAQPDVRHIAEDFPAPPLLEESTALIGAETAWAAGHSGEGQVIAVLDTGIARKHPFLSGKVVSEACYSTNNDSIGSSTLCPNGAEAQQGTGAGVNCPTPVYGCHHGTHVAGIAAGKGDTFSGVARDASLLSIQIFSRFDNNDYCSPNDTPCALSYTSDQIRALERVYELHESMEIAAVNLSLGGPLYGEVQQCNSDNRPRKLAVDNLRSVGILTIAAAGNQGQSGQLATPACISSVVSASATTKSDNVSNFSNVSTFLDFFAPGESIRSSMPGGRYGRSSGTSIAAPHLAGAIAVLRAIAPEADVATLLDLLKETGVPVTDSRNNSITRPRIQLDRAAQRAADSSQSPSDAPTATPTPEGSGEDGGDLSSPLPPLMPEATQTPEPTATPTTAPVAPTATSQLPDDSAPARTFEVQLPAILR